MELRENQYEEYLPNAKIEHKKVAGLGTDNLSRCEDELVAMSCDLCIWTNLQPNNLFVDTPSVTF